MSMIKIIGKKTTDYAETKAAEEIIKDFEEYVETLSEEVTELTYWSYVFNKAIMYNTVTKDNELLKEGSLVRVYRWDGNGSFEEEFITQISVINKFSAKVFTEKGSVIFDTREKDNAKLFCWNEKQKDEWTRSWQNKVYFNQSYIEYNEKKKTTK